jgi:hypothetical protein
VSISRNSVRIDTDASLGDHGISPVTTKREGLEARGRKRETIVRSADTDVVIVGAGTG